MSRFYVKARRTDSLHQGQMADTPTEAIAQAMANPNGWVESMLESFPHWELNALELPEHDFGVANPQVHPPSSHPSA